MTELLTEHLPVVASAPNGVKKLRQLIMQLAVMGKLVPQDPSDEPAQELFEQILVAKEKYALGKKPHSGASLDVVRQEEKKFSLPSSWIWARFGELTVNRDSERVPVASDLRLERRGIYDYYGASGVIDTIDDFLFDKPLLLIGEDGANLVNRSTPIAFIAKGRYWVNNHAHVLDTTEPILMLYLALYINAISLLPFITGTAQPKMNQAKMNQIPVSLPPLAEQHRIVAKFDELMALCDRLDAQQSDAEAAHKQLVKALLATLTHSVDQADFATSWERIKQNFDTIFTTESSIDSLKQALLQLAVMGKLVPQVPESEASISQIERAEFYGEKLPNGWRKVLLSECCSVVTGFSFDSEDFEDQGVPVVKISNVQYGVFEDKNQQYLPAQFLSEYKRFSVAESDLLMALTRPITAGQLKVCRYPEKRPPALLNQRVCKFSFDRNVSEAFMLLQFLSPGFVIQVQNALTATLQPNLSPRSLERLSLVLPPLAEQLRIVDKVDELMAICDSLKNSFDKVLAHQELLSTVIVEQATNSDIQPLRGREAALAV